MPDQFWQMTFYEYNLYAEGYFHRQTREWERTRLIVWATLSPHTKKEIEPTDIMKLPGDPEKEVLEFDDDYFKSKDEIIALWNKFKKPEA